MGDCRCPCHTLGYADDDVHCTQCEPELPGDPHYAEVVK